MTFDVAAGLLTIDPERDKEAPYTIPATSGAQACMNQPRCQMDRDRGPIPQGRHYILSQLPSWWAKTLGAWLRADPVDVSTGLYTMEKTDLVLPGRCPGAC